MDNQIQSQISTLPRVEDLLKRTWQVYKTRLGTFLGIMALPVIAGFLFPILLPTLFLIGGILGGILGGIPGIILGALLFIIFLLINIIISLWPQVSLIFAVKEREEKIGIVESFRKGWHKIISFVWVSILVGFITAGGYGLFIIPGIIFSIWFVFSIYVLVAEDFRGMNALFRSKQLVAGYWWKVLWRFLVMGILLIFIYLILLAIQFVFIFLAPVLVGFAGLVISAIFSLFSGPFAVIFGFLLYEDLKQQKTQVVFEPPKRGTKIKFILLAAIGILLLIFLILAPIILILFAELPLPEPFLLEPPLPFP